MAEEIELSEELHNMQNTAVDDGDINYTNNITNTKAEYFIQQLNATNFKKLALIMVVGFMIYHGMLNLIYGSDSCQWLLSKGHFKGNDEWQPYGCMMHRYTQTDTRRCLHYLAFWSYKNHFIFIGDNSIYLLYKYFINHLNPNDATANEIVPLQPASDTEFEDSQLNMKAIYIHADEVSDFLINRLNKFKDTEEVRAVYIISVAYKQFSQGNVTAALLQEYIKNLTRLVVPIDNLVSEKSKVLWKLEDPVNEEKLPESKKFLHNKNIDEVNRAARSVFRYSDATIWQAAWQISNGLTDKAIDGYQLSDLALKHDLQMILNMYCNDYMNYNDGSCCSSPEPYTMLQVITYSAFGVCIILSFVIFVRRWYMDSRTNIIYTSLHTQDQHYRSTTAPQHHLYGTKDVKGDMGYKALIPNLGMLGIIMIYFYICDRTNFFMKENKYYSEFSFWIPVSYVFALGLFFTEDTRLTKILNRDQSDELKGWMLIVVLIYYMTGANHIQPIHMHIKLLISCFLFHAGYTHFSYVWQTGDASFVRFFQVIFRINFMTVILCFCMNRPYQFYYFVPLLSYWLCVIYFLLSLPPRITSQSVDSNPLHYLYLVIKYICCFSVITILFISEVFFERIFVTRPWKALFVTTDDDIHEWWYQWKLDRYTFIYGMIFATCIHVAQKYCIIDDNNHGNLLSGRLSVTVTFLAFIGVATYTVFSFLCLNVQDCEEIHSYIVFIPIVGYIILRNISGILRTRYSTFFAWFGRISLELFICQYHIWLAADRHGVLVLLPDFPTLNMFITAFIFVCASHEIERITQILIPMIVPNDWKLVTRNFIIFIILLIPIAHADGMF